MAVGECRVPRETRLMHPRRGCAVVLCSAGRDLLQIGWAPLTGTAGPTSRPKKSSPAGCTLGGGPKSTGGDTAVGFQGPRGMTGRGWVLRSTPSPRHPIQARGLYRSQVGRTLVALCAGAFAHSSPVANVPTLKGTKGLSFGTGPRQNLACRGVSDLNFRITRTGEPWTGWKDPYPGNGVSNGGQTEGLSRGREGVIPDDAARVGHTAGDRAGRDSDHSESLEVEVIPAGCQTGRVDVKFASILF